MLKLLLIDLVAVASIQVMVHLINDRSLNSEYHHFTPPQPAPITFVITILARLAVTTITLPTLPIQF